jgi:hypothetical protein
LISAFAITSPLRIHRTKAIRMQSAMPLPGGGMLQFRVDPTQWSFLER